MHGTEEALTTATDEPPDTGKVLGLYKSQDRDSHFENVGGRAEMRAVPVPIDHFSPSSEATTPHLGTSPLTESTFGSSSSLSSLTSSLYHGDYPDLDEFELEPELEPVSEEDELAFAAKDALTLSSDAPKGADQEAESVSTPRTPRQVMARHGLASDEASSTPMPAEKDTARDLSPGPHPTLHRKGRVFELIADHDDVPTPPSAPTSNGADAGPSYDWECQLPSGPPIPATSAALKDTVPPVPSPLCHVLTDQAEPTNDAPSDDEEGNSLSSSVSTLYAHDLNSARKTRARSTTPRPRRRAPSALRRTGASASTPALKSSLVSKDDKRNSRRCRTGGRSCVRFSSDAPIEVRTHSPVDYDRKSCPISNRLCDKDLKELRELSMSLDLLKSRCSSLRGAKVQIASEEAPAAPECDDTTPTQTAPSPPRLPLPDARADVNATCSAPASMSSTPQHEPADPLRDLRRLRDQRKPGVPRASLQQRSKLGRSSSTSELGSMLAARFGLNAPPPPLPGTNASAAISSPSTSTDSLPSLPEEPRRSDFPHSQDPMVCPYDSPAIDLHDSGSEYDLCL